MQKAQEQLYPEELRLGSEKAQKQERNTQTDNNLFNFNFEDFNFDAPIVFSFEGPE